MSGPAGPALTSHLFINFSDNLNYGGQISGGEQHTCILKCDGTLQCFGYNLSGQLGLDDTSTRGNAGGQVLSLNPIAFDPLKIPLEAPACKVGILSVIESTSIVTFSVFTTFYLYTVPSEFSEITFFSFQTQPSRGTVEVSSNGLIGNTVPLSQHFITKVIFY